MKFNAGLKERQQNFIEHSVFRKTPDQFTSNSLCLAELAAGSQCVARIDHRQLTMRDAERLCGLLFRLPAITE